jgi:hypothetical protein
MGDGLVVLFVILALAIAEEISLYVPTISLLDLSHRETFCCSQIEDRDTKYDRISSEQDDLGKLENFRPRS